MIDTSLITLLVQIGIYCTIDLAMDNIIKLQRHTDVAFDFDILYKILTMIKSLLLLFIIFEIVYTGITYTEIIHEMKGLSDG